MIAHYYPDRSLPVRVGARALCGHIAQVETTEPIGIFDMRCSACLIYWIAKGGEKMAEDQGGRFENAAARTAEAAGKVASAAGKATSAATNAATRAGSAAAGATVGAVLGDAAGKAMNKAGK